jgi:hypothetical protein
MRTLFLLLVVMTAGCTGTPRTKPATPPFSLDAPKSLDLLNGLTVKQDVAVNWKQGEPEDLDISAAVEPAGKGVSARPEPARLERGVGPIQLTISATETAAPGDYTLTVTAKGSKSGATARGTITLKVPRKD